MKAVTTPAVIDSIRANKDKSLGLTLSTPELTNEEKVLILELQGVNVKLLIQPVDEPEAPPVTINKDLNAKSQSVRIRSRLFVLWSKNNKGLLFEQFYKQETEKFLTEIGRQIDQYVSEGNYE